MANNSSGGAFNKFLNFIGFVDEEVVDDFDDPEFESRDQVRTYNPSSRRQQPEARPVRSSMNYAGQDRYTKAEQSDRNYRASSRSNDDIRAGYRYDDGSNPYATARPSSQNKAQSRYGSRQDQGQDAPRQSARSPYPERDRERGYSGDEFSSPPKSAPARNQQQPAGERPRNNVVNMRPEVKPQTVIYYLHSLEQCRNVINDLIDNKTILLNLEDMDERYLQRGIDMLAGAAFALNATLRKASNRTYLIAPNSVEIAQTNDVERRY